MDLNVHAMQVNSARRRRAGPPPAGSRPWQRELFKSVMLAPPPTQQQLAAAAGHACSRPSPARNVDPAGPHPPAALQAAAGSGRRRRAEQDKRKPPRRTCSAPIHPRRSITHPAWPQLIGVQRQRQRPQHLLYLLPRLVR